MAPPLALTGASRAGWPTTFVAAVSPQVLSSSRLCPRSALTATTAPNCPAGTHPEARIEFCTLVTPLSRSSPPRTLSAIVTLRSVRSPPELATPPPIVLDWPLPVTVAFSSSIVPPLRYTAPRAEDVLPCTVTRFPVTVPLRENSAPP